MEGSRSPQDRRPASGVGIERLLEAVAATVWWIPRARPVEAYEILGLR
jgi:hypothetical protein